MIHMEAVYLPFDELLAILCACAVIVLNKINHVQHQLSVSDLKGASVGRTDLESALDLSRDLHQKVL